MPRKYSCDYSFFEKIDTQEKAYVLGMWAADGNVFIDNTRKRYHSSLSLSTKDRDHLIKINTVIKSTYPIHNKKAFLNGNTYYNSKIRFTSSKIAIDLIDKGVIPNKSATIQWPTDNIVPSSLKRHYLRGFFDGDGGWCAFAGNLNCANCGHIEDRDVKAAKTTMLFGNNSLPTERRLKPVEMNTSASASVISEAGRSLPKERN